jgi:hypothetical protein
MSNNNKKAPAGHINETRRNGKAWKVRPCGQRHSAASGCTPCHGKAETEKAAALARARKEAAKKDALTTGA